MSLVKNFVDKLENEKWLVYFVLFWAGVLLFWGLYYIYGNITHFDVQYTAQLLAGLFQVVAGLVLGLLGLRLMKINVLSNIPKETLVALFLLLWAGSFFFWGIDDLRGSIKWVGEYPEEVLGIIAGLFELAAGAVLALFGFKLLQIKAEPKQPVA